MPGRSPSAAVAELTDRLQRAASCITEAIFVLSPEARDPSIDIHAAALNRGRPVRLAGGLAEFQLEAALRYRLRQDDRGWTAHGAGYMYAILDNAGDEAFAYHWHPDGRSDVTAPHLHIGRAYCYGSAVIESHFPTGRVSFQQVVRFLLDDLAVNARRADARPILDGLQRTFEAERTWA